MVTTWAAVYTDEWAKRESGNFESVGCSAPFRDECWVPISHNVAWAEAYLRTKWQLDPSDRLATIHQRHRQTTVGWIKMKLGMQVGIGPGHIVLDGVPASSPPLKKHSPGRGSWVPI